MRGCWCVGGKIIGADSTKLTPQKCHKADIFKITTIFRCSSSSFSQVPKTRQLSYQSCRRPEAPGQGAPSQKGDEGSGMSCRSYGSSSFCVTDAAPVTANNEQVGEEQKCEKMKGTKGRPWGNQSFFWFKSAGINHQTATGPYCCSPKSVPLSLYCSCFDANIFHTALYPLP